MWCSTETNAFRDIGVFKSASREIGVIFGDI